MAIRRVGASSTRGLLSGERRPSGNPHHRLPPMPSSVAQAPDAADAAAPASQTPDLESLQTTVEPAAAAAPDTKPSADRTNATTIARLTTDVAQLRVGGKSFTERMPPVDYYSILAASVADLAANTVATRAQVYDHARRVVYQRLAAIQPPLSSFATAREELLLDRAIEKIEAENLKRHPPAEIEDGTAATVEEALEDESPEGVAEPDDVGEAPEIIAPPDRTPPLVAANATRRAQAQQAHGIMLRTFGLVGVIAVCMFGFWLATGRPNLTGERSMTRSFSQLLAKGPAGAAREQPSQVAAVETAPPAPEQAEPAAPPVQQTDSPPVAMQDTPDPGIDIWLACRQAMPDQETMLCPPGTSRSSGAPNDRKSWVTAYSGLPDVTGLAAMPRGNDPATLTRSAAARARFERALERAKADDIDRALADFSEAIKIDPRFAEAHLQRGQTRFKNGDVEGAIADFTRAIEIDSRHAAAYKARGMAMHYKNEEDAAIADLSKAIQIGDLEPNRLSAIDVFYARRSRAVLYDGKQQFDRELADLNAMIESYWKNLDLATSLRASYREQGSVSLMASIHRLRASVNLKRGNLNGAVDDMSLAIQLDKPRALQFTLERARILENAGLRTQAAADYSRVLATSPNNSEAKAGLARVKARS